MDNNLKQHIAVSVLIGITIFLLSLVWSVAEYGILFASFGSSAFLLYYKHRSLHSSSRSILGAYPIAGFFGYISNYYIVDILLKYFHIKQQIALSLSAGIAVALTSIFMLYFGFKHPPAVGASLSFVINKADVGGVFFLIGGGIVLLILSRILIFIIKEGEKLEKALEIVIKEIKHEIKYHH